MIFFELYFYIQNNPDPQTLIKNYLNSTPVWPLVWADWSKSIDTNGPKIAYEDLKNKYALDFKNQHLAAHIFGELLYDKEGVSGISVCDSSFGFGCYHGLFIEAVASKGLGIVGTLDKTCGSNFGGCQHGIGHGLIEYLGHSEPALVQALDQCSKLSWKGEILGCSDGAFMEYNSPNIVSKDKVLETTRPFNPKDPFYPCPILPKKYQPACYYSMGQWWQETFYKNNNYRYEGSLCAGVSDPENKKYCFIGLGYAVAQRRNYDINKIISLCNQMPDLNSRVDCRSGAAIFLYQPGSIPPPTTRYLYTKMCDGLDQTSRNLCLTQSNVENIKKTQIN